MLASTPRPPHLLPSAQKPIMPSSSFASTSRAPTPTMGKAIKGLFSRAKSPEGSDPQTARTRLRSVIGEKRSRPATSGVHSQRTLTKEPDEKRLRPPTPDFTQGGQTKKNIRFAPSALPAMQKGEDGKWQPPSLSRGSVSTSALALYAQGEDVVMEDVSDGTKVGKGKRGNGLTGLFGMTWGKEEDRTLKGNTRDRLRQAEGTVKQDTTLKAAPTLRPSRPLMSPPRASAPEPSTTDLVDTGRVSTTTPLSRSKPASTSIQSPSHRPDPSPLLPAKPIDTARRVRSPTAPPTTQFQAVPSAPPLPHPAHARSHSEPLLSKDHYALRLATSYLLKCLTPIIRGSSFVQNDKNIEMRRMADDRLAQLERMERGWGGEWGEIAAGAFEEGEGLEGKVRAVQVGERTKERERRVWREAIRDGVLLCFLFNHLFPAQPAHIPRVNISEDGILRATNITRVITACQAIHLPADDIFSLADVQDGTESGLGRVAGTILALARLSGRTNPAARSRSPTQPLSRNASRAPSRAASPDPPVSPPRSPRRPTIVETQSRRGSADQRISMDLPRPERRGSDAANDLHVKLQAATAVPKSTTPEITPPNSGFINPKPNVTPNRPSGLGRSSTQPNASPLRPRSPPGTPTRAGTPSNRSSQISVRPVLRPRNTTGSRAQVSFANEPLTPTSARTSIDQSALPSGQGRGRTPSLISSGSRVTSGYTRSSAAFSVNTVIGDDNSHAVDLAEEDEDGSLRRNRHWERRASEKTLHNARQKILGTLLSSEDLPADLQVAIASAHMEPYLQSQPHPIPEPTPKSQPSMEDLRGEALTRSLDALEGVRTPSTSVPGSPSRRIVPRRAYSTEPERTQVNRLSEEDELPASSSNLSELPKPSVIRRMSANGKVYIPKRSASPAPGSNTQSPSPTPTSTSFPFPTTTPAPSNIIGNGMRESKSYLDRPGYRMERRQSDILPSSSVYGGTQAGRVGSMVNLSSSAGSSSLYRESSTPSMIRSGPLQILEFEEAGMPMVRYKGELTKPQLGNCIGRGQFGSVYRSLNLGTGQMAAIKRIRLHGMKEDEVRDVMSEVELLKRLSHPSIVKYEGMSRDEEYLNIVLEFVENGSLGQTLKAFGNFNERLVSSYIAKILEGLDYLHSQGVVHCDLKAANILSTKNGNVKLSDFGVSLNMKAVENIKQDAETRSKGEVGILGGKDVAGTPNWMAPEVISLNGASPASDIWSLGCTIIELLTGRPPYAEITNSMTVLFRIVEDDMPPLPPVSPELEDFLKLCFIKDPSFRPSAAVLFQHPWVRSLNPQLQLLRPQDSVPFLRRVSMSSGRTDSTQLFANGGHRPGSSVAGWDDRRSSQALSMVDVNSEYGRNRYSLVSSHGKEGSDEPRAHTFIKTSFGQAIACRVCHINVKKVGVLCQTCGLISHSNCAVASTSRCDPHEQYARQQEYLQSAASSRYVSPQPSFEHIEASKNFPGRLLQGIKRSSKAALRSTSSVDLGAEIRRRKSSSTALPPPYPQPGPPVNRTSLEPNPGSHHSRQSRTSMMSNVSMGTEDATEEGRRLSAIRSETAEEQMKAKEVRVGVSEALSPVGKVYQQGETGKKDRSDCVVQ